MVNILGVLDDDTLEDNSFSDSEKRVQKLIQERRSHKEAGEDTLSATLEDGDEHQRTRKGYIESEWEKGRETDIEVERRSEIQGGKERVEEEKREKEKAKEAEQEKMYWERRTEIEKEIEKDELHLEEMERRKEANELRDLEIRRSILKEREEIRQKEAREAAQKRIQKEAEEEEKRKAEKDMQEKCELEKRPNEMDSEKSGR